MGSKKVTEVKPEKELKPKTVQGRIAVLKTVPYKGALIHIRQIDEEIFEWLFVFNGELYTNYMIVSLPKGRKQFTLKQRNANASLLFSGAVTTVEELVKEVDRKLGIPEPKPKRVSAHKPS